MLIDEIVVFFLMVVIGLWGRWVGRVYISGSRGGVRVKVANRRFYD